MSALMCYKNFNALFLVKLSDWMLFEDIDEKHLSASPKCNFMRLKRGETFVESFLKKIKFNEKNEKKSHCKVSNESLLDIEKEDKIVSYEYIECKICFEKKADILFIDCFHVCTCLDCAFKVKNKCPICREIIKSSHKIFY